MTETRLQEQLPRVPLAKQGRDRKQKCGRTACRESSQEKWMEAEGLCLLHAAWVDLLSLSQSKACRSINRPPTGKPDAGKPPVRFGGRGGLRAIPTPSAPRTRDAAKK